MGTETAGPGLTARASSSPGWTSDPTATAGAASAGSGGWRYGPLAGMAGVGGDQPLTRLALRRRASRQDWIMVRASPGRVGS